jgi:ATP-dependent exoDNAse (exonuclease V) beta subunit
VVAGDFAQAAVAGEEGAAGPVALPLPPLRRLVRPAGPDWPVAGVTAAAPDVDATGAAETAGDPLDADVGTLVHAYLEMIAREGLPAWPAERVAGLLPAMVVWLAQRGHGEAEAGRGAGRCQAALAATLGSAEGRWVLQARPTAAVELALVRADGGGTSTHIVDRTFIEDGVRWIVDYKTARVDGDEAALRAHAAHYREQLDRYAALFAAEGLPVRTAIFYTAPGRLVTTG